MSVCISVSVRVWGKGQSAKNQLQFVSEHEQETDKDAANLQTVHAVRAVRKRVSQVDWEAWSEEGVSPPLRYPGHLCCVHAFG